MANSAMFAGLVVDEHDNAVSVKYVGTDACYVIDDDGFLRHIDAELVDRQVLQYMQQMTQEHMTDENRDEAVSAMLNMMGKDDLFSKVALESSLDDMIDNMDQAVGRAIPEQTRQWLGMLGFKIQIDEEGNVLNVHLPAGGIDEGY